MGLLTQYLALRSEQERDEKLTQLDAYKAVLNSPDTKPEAKQYAIDQMMKTSGMKGPGKELFTGLLGKLINRKKDGAAKQEAPPSFEGPGVPGGQTGFSRVQATGADGLPETRVKPEMSAGESPSTGMFYSTGEKQEMLRQRKEQADAETLELDRQKFEETQRQKKVVYEATISFYQGQLKQVPDLPLTFEQQNERIMGIARSMEEAGRVYRGLPASEPKQPATPAAEMKPHVIRKADGSEVTAFETSPGKYQTPDGKPVELTAQDKVDPKDPAPPKESQGVRDAAAFYETQGMTPEAARAKALADAEEKAASERKEADLRARKSQQDLTTASESAAEAKRLQQHYEPGGQSIANPKKDGAIEAGAWSWLQTNVTPYYRLPTGYKGTSPQQLMISRANELLADLGLTGQDLAAIRGRAKSELSSLSSASQFAARIQQSEDLLMRNVATAKNLSDQFKRGDIRMYNRVLGAFKTGKGDPEALNLAAQLHIVSREWGKIMAGSTGAAGVPISEGKAADDFVAAKMSDHQLDDLIEKVIKPDAANRVAANQSVIDDLTVKLRNVAKLNAPTSEPTDRLGKSAPGDMKGKSNQELLDILSGKSK